MNILRTEDYIAEKLTIKPVNKGRLHRFKKYKDFFNAENYIDCPQTTDETIYTLAYAMWYKRSWLNPFMFSNDCAFAYNPYEKEKYNILINADGKKLGNYKWVKPISKYIYNSAINMLTTNNITVCGNDMMEIAPTVAIWDEFHIYDGAKYVFYNLSEFIDYKSEICANIQAKSFTALFIKNIVRPNYKKYANQGFFNYFSGINNYKKSIDARTISQDIYGKQVQYIKMEWVGRALKRNTICGWWIVNNGKTESVGLTDVIDGVKDFNI